MPSSPSVNKLLFSSVLGQIVCFIVLMLSLRSHGWDVERFRQTVSDLGLWAVTFDYWLIFMCVTLITFLSMKDKNHG